jgi:tRNA U55 pseudouridine synthase TruB
LVRTEARKQEDIKGQNGGIGSLGWQLAALTVNGQPAYAYASAGKAVNRLIQHAVFFYKIQAIQFFNFIPAANDIVEVVDALAFE